jgi:hypothetical protein
MADILEVIKNIESIYESNTSFQVLKDFERVLDQLDLYVFKNWENGELAEGPKIDKHWVTASFFWPHKEMPDPMGGKRLLDYDCKVRYKKDFLIKPRKIRNPDDVRPGSRKGKLDRQPIWLVEIQMPTALIADMYEGYLADQSPTITPETQPAEQTAQEAPAAAPAAGGTEENTI